MTFKVMNYKDMQKYENEMVQLGVSERARQPDGFYAMYIKHKGNIPTNISYPKHKINYMQRRDVFLKGHIPMYEKNKTRRNLLSLIAWSFDPGS